MRLPQTYKTLLSGWEYGSSITALAKQAQGPEFKTQHHENSGVKNNNKTHPEQQQEDILLCFHLPYDGDTYKTGRTASIGEYVEKLK
jgi:hypothetical protein